MKSQSIYWVIVMFVALTSCTYEKAQLNISCDIPQQVSFSNDIIPVFNKHCNTAGCHSGASPTGGLNLESTVAYTQLMSSGSGYIDTITPKYSVLHASMSDASNPMPPTGKLDKCTLDLIYKWIEQKAKNN